MCSTIAPSPQLLDCFFRWRSWAPVTFFDTQILHQKKTVLKLGAGHDSWAQFSRNWPQGFGEVLLRFSRGCVKFLKTQMLQTITTFVTNNKSKKLLLWCISSQRFLMLSSLAKMGSPKQSKSLMVFSNKLFYFVTYSGICFVSKQILKIVEWVLRYKLSFINLPKVALSFLLLI